ncbi:MAG: hypothetical protein JRJ62_15190 [Deltaproteobacteria bacterium]|nr:hypothetical protein [Deltaproteobacteria bacterium]
MHQEEIFEKMKRKYHEAIYSNKFWPTIHAIRDDIKFFYEYAARFKKVTGFFGYEIRLATPGLIYNFFFRQADDYIRNGCEDALEHTLEIFWMLIHLFNGWQNTDGITNEEIVKDIIIMDDVVRWYLGGNAFWYLSSFIGSNHTIEKLKSEISRLSAEEQAGI